MIHSVGIQKHWIVDRAWVSFCVKFPVLQDLMDVVLPRDATHDHVYSFGADAPTALTVLSGIRYVRLRAQNFLDRSDVKDLARAAPNFRLILQLVSLAVDQAADVVLLPPPVPLQEVAPAPGRGQACELARITPASFHATAATTDRREAAGRSSYSNNWGLFGSGHARSDHSTTVTRAISASASPAIPAELQLDASLNEARAAARRNMAAQGVALVRDNRPMHDPRRAVLHVDPNVPLLPPLTDVRDDRAVMRDHFLNYNDSGEFCLSLLTHMLDSGCPFWLLRRGAVMERAVPRRTLSEAVRAVVRRLPLCGLCGAQVTSAGEAKVLTVNLEDASCRSEMLEARDWLVALSLTCSRRWRIIPSAEFAEIFFG
jgi:hypothetical protein